MSKIQVVKRVQAVPSHVWNILADYGAVSNFHPFVQRSYTQSAAERGVGAVRKCEFYDGNHVVEKVTSWQEGRAMTIEIVEGTMPLSRAEAKITVDDGLDGTTIVTMNMDVTPKGVMGAMMGPVMGIMFRRMLTKLLDGLDHHARTGEIVGRKGSVEAPTIDMKAVPVTG